MKRTRLTPAQRKDQILKAAAELACNVGYTHVTRQGAADAAGVSMGLVTHYYGTVPQLQRDIMRYAIRENIAEIIAQGLTLGDKHARKLPEAKKREVLETLAQR